MSRAIAAAGEFDPEEHAIEGLVIPPEPLGGSRRPSAGSAQAGRFRAWLRTALGRFLGNLLWFLFFQFIFSWWWILYAIVFAAAGIAAMFGCKVEMPEWLKHPAQAWWRAAKEKIPKEVQPVAVPTIDNDAIKKQADAVKAQAEAARAQAELGIREKVEANERKLREDRLRNEADERDRLLVRARAVGVAVGDGWTNARIESEVELAEQARRLEARAAQAKEREQEEIADYETKREAYDEMLRTGPNARCPFCGKPTRVSDAHKKVTLQCKACLSTYGGARARAMWTPPPPPVPPKGYRGLFQ